MATIINDTEVEVGETSIGEIYVGEVDVGTVTREVELEVDPADFWEACSVEEKQELTEIVLSYDEILESVLTAMPYEEFKEILEIIRKVSVDTPFQDLKPPTQLRHEVEEISRSAIAMPSYDLIRSIKTFREMTPEQLRSFPQHYVREVLELLQHHYEETHPVSGTG